MARALITGVAGFIGSHVAEHCVAMGLDVVGIDDLSGGFSDNVPKGVDFRLGSIVDYEWLGALWRDAPFDYVYHLAAYAAEGLSHFIRRFNYTNNLIGSVNLINLAVIYQVKCFVFTSSIAVYGVNQTPMTEQLTPKPEDPYGIAKYAVELDLEAARRLFGLNYIIFRPHNVYGERQNVADKYRNVIGIFMNQLLRGQSMTIFGDGQQSRAFSHVDDVAPIIAGAPLVKDAYGQAFNVGADTPYTVLELAREVAAAFDVEARVTHLPAREEVVHAFASHEKAARVFGKTRTIPLGEGIRRMAEWVRASGPRDPVDFQNVEVTRNMPASWRSAGDGPKPD
jgi:UDP-glucose 4-epimerase